MAQDVEKAAQAGDNSKSRGEQLDDAFRELYAADVRIAAALEKHVKPERAVKRDINAKLRDDLNLSVKLVNARYSTYKIEQAAIEEQDQSTIETLRELHRILPVGGQSNMLDALGA